MEQVATLNSMNFDLSATTGPPSFTFVPAQTTAAATVVATFICPSDGQSPFYSAYYLNTSTAGTGYVANVGSGTGTYYDMRYPPMVSSGTTSATRIADIMDGTTEHHVHFPMPPGTGAGHDRPHSDPTRSATREHRFHRQPREGRPRRLHTGDEQPGPRRCGRDGLGLEWHEGSRLALSEPKPWWASTLIYLPTARPPDVYGRRIGWLSARSPPRRWRLDAPRRRQRQIRQGHDQPGHLACAGDASGGEVISADAF